MGDEVGSRANDEGRRGGVVQTTARFWPLRSLEADTARAVAGAVGGAVAATVVSPFDVVKARLQVQRSRNGQYRGTFPSLYRIVSREGLRGLYRGLHPTLLGYVPSWGVYFFVYDDCKAFVTRVGGVTSNETAAIAGAGIAGSICQLTTNPMWVVRTRLQTQRHSMSGPPEYRGTGHAFRSIYRSEGILGFYRGLAVSLLGVTHVMVQFPLYERCKRSLLPRDRPPSESPWLVVVCASISKASASLCTYPHEVIRSRLHIDRGRDAGIASEARALVVSEGITALYRGFSVNLMRTVPSCASMLLSYEFLVSLLTKE